MRISFALCVSFCFGSLLLAAAIPGETQIVAQHTGDSYLLQNNVAGLKWQIKDGRVQQVVYLDKLHGKQIPAAIPFRILLKDGRIYDAENVAVSGIPSEKKLIPAVGASRFSETLAGEEFNVPLESSDKSVRLLWSVVLREGSSYIRQSLTITADSQSDLPINQVRLIDLELPAASVSGSVSGSPIVTPTLFFGFEHPISQSKIIGDKAIAWIDRDLPLKAGQSITYSSVFGVVHEGQMRREFLAYIERERAHPYRTFLHYNSWYDLGYFTPYDQAGAVDRINTFGRELTEQRGVKISSFLFDDGWDNHKSLWKFNDGFPHGFTEVKTAAERIGADPGVWMSPWGGYAGPKKERIEYGKSEGYEIVQGGYALSGPKYYAAFRDVSLDMVKKYGVNQFKFDGTGNVDSVFRGSAFDSDFSAAIHLIGELREAKPDLFINLTTGTWPSPFWLQYADSIWRGGEDDDFMGVGSYRQRWITYRDGDTYRRIVVNGPLYPLNSLMLHGMIFAKFRKHLNDDPQNDFRSEIRSYFGTGTQLQEMYITPSLLSKQNWDDLAEAARWSRENVDVLKDTHWVGGDPNWLEVYGWASWTPKKGILVLRNPNDKPQTITLKLKDAFELPAGSVPSYTAKSPWKDDQAVQAISIRADQPHTFRLEPFQVQTLEFTPSR